MAITRGTKVIAMKTIKPWAPFKFRSVPVGARGVVLKAYVEVYPTLGKPRKIPYANVRFRWVDKKGVAKQAVAVVILGRGEVAVAPRR